MDYALDMPPYIKDIANWLDDPAQTHPCSFDNAYRGFEITMALCRSAAEGGQIRLPLEKAGDEIQMLKDSVAQREVILAIPASAKEYPAGAAASSS